MSDKRYVIKPVGGLCGELHTDEGQYIDNKKWYLDI